MAGSDSQKQLLTLIRDFSTEKSQGERRIVNQKKRIEDLTSELDASNKELEEAKRDKETIEQDLKGYEVELSMTDASIQALEARVALTNNEISKLGSEMAALKSEEKFTRDGFIAKMLELNSQIRKIQEFVPSTVNADNCSEATSNFGMCYACRKSARELRGSLIVNDQDVQQDKVGLENKIAQIVMHTNQEEEQYKAEQVIHDQVQQELSNLEKKAQLLESVMKEYTQQQELSRQMSELEEKCAALGDELQERFSCPRCHQDNSEELGQILQISDGN
ncbi:hypothetical protein ABFX02_08G017600 [Erythranthe guttata]